MAIVGVVVNPNAASDVRRLTSLAPNLLLDQRVSVTARVLAGLLASGVDDIVVMAEPFDIARRAVSLLARTDDEAVRHATVRPVGSVATDAEATRRSAAEMRETGAACVVTVGGDGTVRAVAAGWPGGVIVPVAGGTNNTVALRVAPEAAGRAAGSYALDPPRWARFVQHRTVLDSHDSAGGRHLAVADVALTRHGWIGSHAVWEPEALIEAVLARSDATVAGLAGLGGLVAPLADGEALHLSFGEPGQRLLAPFGPGRFLPITVREWAIVAPGDEVALTPPPGTSTVAFDGERELVVRSGDRIRVSPRGDGLRVLAVEDLLRQVTVV